MGIALNSVTIGPGSGFPKKMRRSGLEAKTRGSEFKAIYRYPQIKDGIGIGKQQANQEAASIGKAYKTIKRYIDGIHT
tara:strand:- start:19231 stop:19464 length:234 start_codon:yes stop_codon:yes gene_type:complete